MGKPHHERCPDCGHIWSKKGEQSECARQHCDECGWDWRGPNPFDDDNERIWEDPDMGAR